MKTKMNLARGGASASKKLLAAIAVLAVAFVVFAAIPAVDAEGAASTYYVDSESGNDTNAGTDGAPFKTLNKAIETATSGSKILLKGDLGTETTVNCNKYLLSGHLNAAIKVNKSLTIESASVNEKAVIPYALWICEDSSNQKVEVSLKNLVVDPVENDYAIGVGQGAASKLTVSGCDLKIQPYATGDDQVAAIYVYQSRTDIVVENSNFKIDGNKGNGYTSAIMVWQGKATINHNVVDGYSKFLNIDGMTELTVTNNTAKNMLGPFKTSRGELKNGTFIQFATTSGAQTQVTYAVDNNRVEASDAGFIDIATYPTSTSPTKINALDTDMDVVFRGTVELKGAAIEGNIVLEKQNGVESVVKVNDDLPLANGKTLTVGNGSTLSGNVSGNGKVIVEAGANVSSATFAPETQVRADESSMFEMIVGGDSITGTEAQKTIFGVNQIVTVSKEAGYWNLVDGTVITIEGKLVVPEGTTLTVQAGAKLIFADTAIVEIEGTLVIEDEVQNAGSVEPTPAGKITQNDGKVVVTGTAQIAGEYTAVAGQFIAEQDSVVTVEETGKLVSANIVVKDSANFRVEGTVTNDLAASVIENYGVVIFDSKVPAKQNVTVKMMADGATVVIDNYTVASTGTKLTITDEGMVVYEKNTEKVVIGTDFGKANKVELGLTATVAITGKNVTISGITVVEKLTSKASDGQNNPYGYVEAAGKTFDNRMQISGTAVTSTVSTDTNVTTVGAEQYGITLSAGRGITVPAGESGTALTVGLNVVLTNDAITEADKKVLGLEIEGAVDATADSKTEQPASFVNKGTITVVKDGSVKTRYAETLDKETGAKVNGTLYVTGTTDKINNYVEIDAALAMVNADGNTVKALTVLGKQTVDATATVPANVTVTLKDAQLIIGAKAGADVILTVNKAGALKGTGTVTVNGTLFAEDKTKLSVTKIVSDVKSEEIRDGEIVRNGWVKYTNIVAALNGAEDGQTITISKANEDGKQYVAIASDIAIKAGVTLVVGDDFAPLKLADGVTLTVAGTLQTEQPVYAATKFDLKASNLTTDKSSAIVVDGTVKAAAGAFVYGFNATPTNKSTADGAPIAGAYYTDKDYSVISTLAIAVQNVKDIQSEITVNGKVSVGDIAFSGNDDYKTIVIGKCIMAGSPAKVKYETLFQASSLTLADGAQLAIKKAETGIVAGSFTGSVVVGDAAVDMVGATAEPSSADSAATIATFVKESEGKLVLLNVIHVCDKDDKLTVSKGTVYMDNGFSVDSIEDKTNGVFSVASGAVLEPVSKTATGTIEALTVDGTLNVPSGSTVTVGTLTVNGTAVVAPATSTATVGTLTVTGSIYIGMAASDIEKTTGAAASVSGAFGFGTAYIADGAVLDDAALAVLSADGVNKLAFNVQGKLWFTAYSTTSASVTANKAPLTNAILAGWSETEGGKAIVYEADVPAGADSPTHKKGDAKYEFAIDGKTEALYAVVDTYIYKVTVVAEAGIENIAIDGNLLTGNSTMVAAGTHAVTYTLKNGYTGNATMTVNGQKQTGLSFSTSGTSDADRTVSIQLSGITASGYVDPTPVVPEEKDDGMSLTDILLIVLVVLIVIMAVIVAMRLMRS